MQARKFNHSKDFFGQGSIFRLDKVRFKDSKNIHRDFSYFYPHADMHSIKYAIMCTQDCDIQNSQKVTHINIILLEPIQRPKKDNPIKFIQVDYPSLVSKFENMNFYSLGSLSGKLQSKIELLVNNTSAQSMFIQLSKKKYYFINLSKMYPIKIEHLENVRENAEYQLVQGFKPMLGWKLANLYGRVGVDEYAQNKKEEIIKNIFHLIGTQVKSNWPSNSYEISDEQLTEIKKLIGEYDKLKEKGRETEKQKKIIYQKLADYEIVKLKN